MDHLDLALSRQQEAVYSSSDESGNAMMSERVSSLATSIYAEFERLIASYGQDVLENLMPMVVSVLEQLDSAYTEENDRSLELELISEDNEQLITQYEREKQLRKLAETKFLEYEDTHEQEKRELQNELELLQHQNRQGESKLKNLQDHVERLEERLSEQKKEYASLHQRHSEMIQSFMERMEGHSKLSPGVASGSTDSPFLFSSLRRQPNLSIDSVNNLNISASQPNLAMKSGSNLELRSNLGRSTSIQSDIQPQPNEMAAVSRNDLSFEDELSAPRKDSNTSQMKEERLQEQALGSDLVVSGSPSRDTAEMSTSTTDLMAVGSEKHVTSTPLRLATVPEDQVASTHKGDDVHGIPVMSLSEAELSVIGTSDVKGGYSADLSQEAQAILDSTPELTKAGTEDETVAESLEAKNARERNNRLSLFAELSSQEPSYVGEMDLGSSLNPVGKELETLIKENEELLGFKNKVTTQKNDLLMRLEEISSEKDMLQEEISSLQTTRGRMKFKVAELEQELKKTKHELEKAHIAMKNKSTEETGRLARFLIEGIGDASSCVAVMMRIRGEWDLHHWPHFTTWDDKDRVSSANRKRFTRVEMARVLMERNQYKERLMELQEAVRWTEMIRATKENHIAAIQQKKKTSVWKFFSNLFASGSSVTGPPVQRRSPGHQPVSIWYGSRSSTPQSHRRHSSIGTGNRESGFDGLTERQRQERKERYKFVKEHINSEGRLQAYGWSLPADYNADQEDLSKVPVPIPVYCRPLNTDPAMKIWCAAGVNLNGSRNRDGQLIGLSPDYQEPSFSTVWIGTSTHSCSRITIIDSNTPATAKEHFIVCSSHLLCMSAVPGKSEEDFNYFEGLEEREQPGDTTDGRRTPLSMLGRASSLGSVSRQTPEAFELSSSDNVESVGSITGIQVEEESTTEEDQTDGSQPKCSSALPTMWLGAQSGKVYIHSVITNPKKCLQTAKLKDSVLSIVHIKGRVLAALADGTVAIFHRRPDGRWDLSNYHLLDLGRPHHSIRCMTAIHGKVWCGYRNKIQVINPQNMRIVKTFDAHPRRESQVRQLAHIGDGVWVSIRLDSTLRLYNAHTYHHLQDIDIEPYVSKMLGTGKLGFSFVRITALLLTNDRLWVGTGNGVILSIPLVSSRPCREDADQSRSGSMLDTSNGALHRTFTPNGKETKFMPYCSMVHAQLSFHGHRDSVKFFVAVPGSASNVTAAKAYSMAGAPPPSPSMVREASPERRKQDSMLVMSGGEGYIDFRVGDDETDEVKGSEENVPMTSKLLAAERSHLLVWQVAES